MGKNSFVEGSIGKSIIIFLIPILASNLIQQLYGTVNIICVANFSGKEATAAIGSGDLIITILIGFFSGMSVGTNVIAAHLYGQRNHDKFRRVMQTVFVMGIAGGVVLTVIGICFAPIFLTWMNTPAAIFSLAVVYLRIYMLSILSIILYNLCAGILRAMGDSRSPMIFQLMGGILNIGLGILLIGVLDRGVAGAATASFLSQTFVAVLLLRHLYRQRSEERLMITLKIFDWSLFVKIFNIGFPAGVQAVVITLSNIIIQSKINSFGVDAIAAFTAYFKIEMLLYIPIIALGQALVSFVGQNYGAKKYDRIKRGFKGTVFAGSAGIAVLSTILLLNASGLFHFFTQDSAVILNGVQIVTITFPFYFLYVILECLSAESRGKGKAMFPMAASVISFCGIRILLLMYILSTWNDIRGIAVTYPISWASVVLLLLIYRHIVIAKEKSEHGY